MECKEVHCTVDLDESNYAGLSLEILPASFLEP